MWRTHSHQPLQPAPEARHRDNQTQGSSSDLEKAQDGRIGAQHHLQDPFPPEAGNGSFDSLDAPVVPTQSVASMSPNSATAAKSTKDDRNEPRTGTRGVARPTKNPRKRKSIGRQTKKKKNKAVEKPQEDFWPIKDIIDEEIGDRGATRYLVEWEGLDENGLPYKPEWVQDVTDDALQAWQAKQGDRSASDLEHGGDNNTQSSQSEPPSERPTRAPEPLGEVPDCVGPRPRKRQRIVVLDSQDTQELSSNCQLTGESGEIEKASSDNLKRIVVELARTPGFDPLAYTTVQPSQESQLNNQLGVITQAISSSSSQSRTEPLSRALFESNRTIPDSQEPSTLSVSDPSRGGSQLVSDLFTAGQSSLAVTALSQSTANSQAGQQLLDTAAEIPSHQPELHVSGQEAIPFPDLLSQYQSADSVDHSYSAHPSAVRTLFEPSQFQTQEPYHSQPDTPTSPAVSVHIASDQHSQPAPSRISSQAAQIVPHSINQPQGISSQFDSPRDFSLYNDNSNVGEVVPESSRQPGSELQDSQQKSSQALAESDGNSRISSAPSRHGLGSEPGTLQSSQHCAEKPSDKCPADEAKVVESSHPNPLPSQVLTSVSQTSDIFTIRDSRPATPINKMEEPASSEKPLTARERLRLISERAFGSAPDDASSIHSTVQDQVNGSVVAIDPAPEEPITFEHPPTISPALLVHSVEVDHQEEAAPLIAPDFESTAPSYDLGSEDHPATLNPAALTLSIEDELMEPENEDDGSPSIPTDDDAQPLSEHPDSSDEIPITTNNDVLAPEPNILPYIESNPNEFIVTLPLASNIRPQYVEAIKESNDDLVAYNAAFTVPPYHAPEQALVDKVDAVFNRLLDLCDLPSSMDALQQMSPTKITKYIRSTHSKYAFIGQFLESLLANGSSQKRVLLLARPGPIIDLLNNLLATEGYHACELQGGIVVNSSHNTVGTSANSWSSGRLIVTVYPTQDLPYVLQSDYDVIIPFDHTYRLDLMPARLIETENPPVTLALVTTTSIQHINMRISEKIEPLGRKNYLLLALCASIEDMLNPDPGFPQAHQIAGLFANYIEAPDDDEFYWTPQEPSESIFEHIAASSQVEGLGQHPSVLPNGLTVQMANRKRSLDEADETESKRPKMAQPEIARTTVTPQIPDSLKAFIGEDLAAIKGTSSVVQVSVEFLEALAVKMAKMETDHEKTRTQRDQSRELADRTKREVDSWTTSMNRIQPRYMAALRDRGKFQKERDVALKSRQDMALRLQTTEHELSSAREKITTLTQKLSEAQESLITGNNPDLAKMARIENEVEEARAKFTDYEKIINSAKTDRDYASTEYQKASQRALELRKENDELQRRVIELTRKADDNIVLINQTQQRNEVRELVRLLEEQRVIVRDRENELNRVREQLASIKNGRRETRQSSVPRSPRLGVSSPRNPGRRAATEAASGAPSRGASPAPLGTFEVGGNLTHGVGSLFAGQHQGNGRYAHLRD